MSDFTSFSPLLRFPRGEDTFVKHRQQTLCAVSTAALTPGKTRSRGLWKVRESPGPAAAKVRVHTDTRTHGHTQTHTHIQPLPSGTPQQPALKAFTHRLFQKWLSMRTQSRAKPLQHLLIAALPRSRSRRGRGSQAVRWAHTAPPASPHRPAAQTRLLGGVPRGSPSAARGRHSPGGTLAPRPAGPSPTLPRPPSHSSHRPPAPPPTATSAMRRRRSTAAYGPQVPAAMPDGREARRPGRALSAALAGLRLLPALHEESSSLGREGQHAGCQLSADPGEATPQAPRTCRMKAPQSGVLRLEAAVAGETASRTGRCRWRRKATTAPRRRRWRPRRRR